MTDKVVLIGFMGAGKTTVGARMAAQLDTYQHDLDQIIEQHLGESIQDFFAREGEAAFRTLEAQVLDRQLAETGILSTGGGVVMTPTSRQLLQRTATPVVYLRTQPEELLRRLKVIRSARYSSRWIGRVSWHCGGTENRCTRMQRMLWSIQTA